MIRISPDAFKARGWRVGSVAPALVWASSLPGVCGFGRAHM